MSDTKVLFLGVLAIFVGAGALALHEAFQQEYDERKAVCFQTCLPYFGEPAAKNKCLCDMMKLPNGEDERP